MVWSYTAGEWLKGSDGAEVLASDGCPVFQEDFRKIFAPMLETASGKEGMAARDTFFKHAMYYSTSNEDILKGVTVWHDASVVCGMMHQWCVA